MNASQSLADRLLVGALRVGRRLGHACFLLVVIVSTPFLLALIALHDLFADESD